MAGKNIIHFKGDTSARVVDRLTQDEEGLAASVALNAGRFVALAKQGAGNQITLVYEVPTSFRVGNATLLFEGVRTKLPAYGAAEIEPVRIFGAWYDMPWDLGGTPSNGKN
jgi:hypothetical protein